jgi:protein-S-isoprenylcysteine O-methyltransferase Ste14
MPQSLAHITLFVRDYGVITLSLFWQLLFYGWLVSEILVGIATRTKHSSGKVRDRGSLLILWIVITASVTACQWFSETHARNMFSGAHALKTAGVIVMLAGLAIRWTAIFTLGKSFSSNVAIQDAQQITRTGLFHFVRHPSYLGLLLVFLAIGVHSRNWISLAVVLLPTTAALLYRIHVEEIALAEAFGEEYLAYRKATKRLVPGIY